MMDLIPNDWKHLQLKLLKRKILFKARKVKNSKNSQIKKFTSSFNLIVLNNAKSLSNSFHGQTSWKDTISSVKKALMDTYIYNIFCLVYTYSFFSSLKPCNTQYGQRTKNSVPQMQRTRKISTPFYIFLDARSKITLEFISELINLNISFNIPFKISLKTTKELLLNSMMVHRLLPTLS